jgi:putative phage-type endonuclease
VSRPGWQGSAEWHAARRSGIGSSDAPILTGDAPWGDVLTLYAQKTGIIDPPDIKSAPMAWGLKLEATVADWFTETTGKKVRRANQLRRHPDHSWMLASLDRVVVGERMVCEIKTARFANDEWGESGTAEIPAHYLVQVQHQIAVGGFEGAYVAVLFAGSDPRLYVVPRDEALIEALIELEAEFMDCVRTGTPPEAIIRKQRPAVALREGEIVADETLATGIEGVYHLRSEIKALEVDKEKAEAAVKTLLGPNTAARAGAYRATYKQNADSKPIRWELVAAAYRKAIQHEYDLLASGDMSETALPTDPEWLDSVESLFTDLIPGKRPLLIRRKEEATENAA